MLRLHCGGVQWLIGQLVLFVSVKNVSSVFLIEGKPSKELGRQLEKAGKTQDMVITCDRSKSNYEGPEEGGYRGQRGQS